MALAEYRFVTFLAVVVILPSCVGPASEGGHNWEEEPHHISLLGSGTFEPNEESASIGVDYEYRLSHILGVGAVAEYAFNPIDATTLLAVADLHITRHFVFQTGPGVEFIRGETEVVYRFGALYEFEWNGYTLSPQVHYDWTTAENAFVVGLAIGLGF